MNAVRHLNLNRARIVAHSDCSTLARGTAVLNRETVRAFLARGPITLTGVETECRCHWALQAEFSPSSPRFYIHATDVAALLKAARKGKR